MKGVKGRKTETKGNQQEVKGRNVEWKDEW